MKNDDRGFSKIDAMLVVVIVASCAFIVYQFALRPTKGTQDIGVSSAKLTQAAPLPVATQGSPMDQGIEYSDSDWTELLKDPAFKNRLLRRSPGCTAPSQRTEWGIPVTSRDIQTRPLVGNWRTWMVNEKIRCFQVGQILHVVTFDRLPTSLAVRYSGTVTVTSIAELPLESYPQSVFDFFKVSRKDGIEFLRKNSVRTPSGMEMLIRTSDINRKVEPFANPPRLLPAGKTITRAELQSLGESDISVIDVRSPAEFKNGSLPNAQNVPFGASDPRAAQFDPHVLNSTLNQYTFDTAKFAHRPTETVVLVGDSEKDPRPLWASLVLFDMGISKMYWVVDGVGASPQPK